MLLLDKTDLKELASASSEQKEPLGIPQASRADKTNTLTPTRGKRISFFQNPKEDLARMVEQGEKAKILMHELESDANFFDAWVKRRNSVIKSLSLGEVFIKHKNRRGQKRFVYMPKGKKGFIIAWCKSQKNAKSSKYQGFIPVSEIRGVVQGKASLHFKRTAKENCSFSIVGRERTLDLECDNIGMCKKWVKFFEDILLVALVSDAFVKRCRKGWSAHVSDEGLSYFYHEASGRSTWTVPEIGGEESLSPKLTSPSSDEVAKKAQLVHKKEKKEAPKETRLTGFEARDKDLGAHQYHSL
eukprot:g5393.t1